MISFFVKLKGNDVIYTFSEIIYTPKQVHTKR